MLSQRARYALKALLNLARSDRSSQQVSNIADQENIPRKFLETIMSDLRRAGLVTSQRGSLGGYRLARPADLITFADIIRVTDGPISMLPCVSRNFYERCEDCSSEEACALRKVFAEVRTAVTDILEHRSLADALLLELPEKATSSEVSL
ncbi:Rrf2 family transcriptional regulator [Gluconacetobacter liquefaciens]|uniref:Rrf2 family transcriptional regulator n=1 Tax=Gluconacetobacter liquefaciens TaxID=89584 RepID=A0A370FYN7_GLULI|nr:Rrf2 family transcriptional regulator [Gluconacetobacter liquefaciens]MBB2187883.1 Rrf2 family transcriptional regulator [Gluconacetobacter liquefaciens]RDI34232.1 BadM/Rrf2 family transcriptional regulator [Gluconacetobacter liquefaciens]GBQ98660.1 putative transcriptional regulator [Gluconacetobacter liquefaciens NRIC 0522]GEB38805.1 Rrf2 family transcriptional regulator [Gluconacetobacter liquefaciens]